MGRPATPYSLSPKSVDSSPAPRPAELEGLRERVPTPRRGLTEVRDAETARRVGPDRARWRCSRMTAALRRRHAVPRGPAACTPRRVGAARRRVTWTGVLGPVRSSDGHDVDGK